MNGRPQGKPGRSWVQLSGLTLRIRGMADVAATRWVRRSAGSHGWLLVVAERGLAWGGLALGVAGVVAADGPILVWLVVPSSGCSSRLPDDPSGRRGPTICLDVPQATRVRSGCWSSGRRLAAMFAVIRRLGSRSSVRRMRGSSAVVVGHLPGPVRLASARCAVPLKLVRHLAAPRVTARREGASDGRLGRG